MEMYLGKRSRFSYTKEATYGTVPAAGTTWGYIPVESVTPSSKSELIQINTLDSNSTTDDSRNVDNYYESLRRYGVSIEGLVQHFRFCAMAWGEDNDSYALDTHTISETNEIQPFSMNFGYQHSSSPGIMEYAGCMINKLDFSCTKGEFLKFTAEVVAQKATSSPTWKDPYDGDGREQYTMDELLPYHYSHASIELDNVAYCETDAIKMSINNNLLTEPVLCADNEKRISEPIPQLREYDASATIRMDDMVLYDLWETGTTFTDDPVITFTRDRGSGDIDVLTFTLVNTTLESAISPLKISEGIVLVELPMKIEQITVTEETNKVVDEY